MDKKIRGNQNTTKKENQNTTKKRKSAKQRNKTKNQKHNETKYKAFTLLVHRWRCFPDVFRFVESQYSPVDVL